MIWKDIKKKGAPKSPSNHNNKLIINTNYSVITTENSDFLIENASITAGIFLLSNYNRDAKVLQKSETTKVFGDYS